MAHGGEFNLAHAQLILKEWLQEVTSGFASPARKKQRLSSPDYSMDEDLGEDVLVELNRIETLSQLERRAEEEEEKAKPSRRMDAESRRRRLMAIELALSQEGNMKSVGKIVTSMKVAKDNEDKVEGSPEESMVRPTSGPSTPPPPLPPVEVQKNVNDSSSSQEDRPPEEDYSNWFEETATASFVGFQKVSASTAIGQSFDDAIDACKQTHQPLGSASLGFSSASKIGKAVLEPSKEALAQAAKKMKGWSEEIESDIQASQVAINSPKPVATPARPVLATITNTPGFASPLIDRPGMPIKSKPFKTPFLPPSMVKPAVTGTPERPGAALPNLASGFTTPVRPGMSPALGSARRGYKSTFKTPFKRGLEPGAPGRAQLAMAQQVQKAAANRTHKPVASSSKCDFHLALLLSCFVADKCSSDSFRKIDTEGFGPQATTIYCGNTRSLWDVCKSYASSYSA